MANETINDAHRETQFHVSRGLLVGCEPAFLVSSMDFAMWSLVVSFNASIRPLRTLVRGKTRGTPTYLADD